MVGPGYRFSCRAEASDVVLSVIDHPGGHSIRLSADEARTAIGEIEAAIRDARSYQHEADAAAAHG